MNIRFWKIDYKYGFSSVTYGRTPIDKNTFKSTKNTSPCTRRPLVVGHPSPLAILTKLFRRE